MRKKVFILGFLIMLMGIGSFVGCSKTQETVTNSNKDKANDSDMESNTDKVSSSDGDKAKVLTISVGMGLKNAMEEINTLYKKENPKVELRFIYGSAGSRMQQIEQGAPVDVFFSPGKKQLDKLQSKGFILEDSRTDLLKDRVVLIAPKDSSSLQDFKDLEDEKVKKIGVGEPKSVPAGQYAYEVLKNLSLLGKVEPKISLAKDVREVLAWVESGSVDAGIVYETDAMVSKKVKVISVAPDGSHSPVIFTVAVLKNSQYTEEAKEFIEFMSGEKGKQVFEKLGFDVIKK